MQANYLIFNVTDLKGFSKDKELLGLQIYLDVAGLQLNEKLKYVYQDIDYYSDFPIVTYLDSGSKVVVKTDDSIYTFHPYQP